MSSVRAAVATHAGVPMKTTSSFPGADVWMALIILTMPIREVSLWQLGAAHGRIGDMVLAACLPLWFASACLRGQLAIVRNHLDSLIVAFLTLYALSILWTSNLDAGSVRILKLLRNGMLYILLADYLITDFDARYRKVAACLVLSGLSQSLAFGVSLSQHGLPALALIMDSSSLPSNDPVLAAWRFDQGGGLFLKGVSYWLPLCIFAGLSLVPTLKARTFAILTWTVIFVMGVLVLLSATRGSWIGILVGLFVMGAASASRITFKKIIVILVIGALIVVGAGSLGVHNFVKSRLNTETIEGDPAVEDRLEFYEFTLQRFTESPIIGTGVGGIDRESFFPVHNVYLQVLGELGVMGAVIFILVIGVWVKYIVAAKSLASRNGEVSTESIAVAMLGATVFFLTYSLVAHDLGGGEPWVIMGITSGLYGSTRSFRDGDT